MRNRHNYFHGCVFICFGTLFFTACGGGDSTGGAGFNVRAHYHGATSPAVISADNAVALATNSTRYAANPSATMKGGAPLSRDIQPIEVTPNTTVTEGPNSMTIMSFGNCSPDGGSFVLTGAGTNDSSGSANIVFKQFCNKNLAGDMVILNGNVYAQGSVSPKLNVFSYSLSNLSTQFVKNDGQVLLSLVYNGVGSVREEDHTQYKTESIRLNMIVDNDVTDSSLMFENFDLVRTSNISGVTLSLEGTVCDSIAGCLELTTDETTGNVTIAGADQRKILLVRPNTYSTVYTIQIDLNDGNGFVTPSALSGKTIPRP